MRRYALPIAAALVAATACAKSPGDGLAPETVVVRDTVFVDRVVSRVETVADPDTRQRLSQIEVEVLTRDARIQVLTEELEEARREVVRTMARSQTVASRAEAASGIAEAELAIRTLRTAAGTRSAPEVRQAEQLLQESNAEFEQGNFGGALYLASQSRAKAGQGTDRFRRAEGENLRPGETQFQAPLRLQTNTRSNVRDGPGTNYRVLYTLEPQQPVTGLSYVEGWVRITDAEGRVGWIARSLVESRP
ncbi:MAG: SH3 domain-containing protein [Gemmatimonadota bacterium]|nr:SH3 domain-containing protein [Gemmatimonadota bacterium]MDH4349698.1 SH3 domain-containing protein [Gemmatimonadota bacterium]MDH5196251.1 SH3 domain-containing protein [Gemmatimonadota bacterium]